MKKERKESNSSFFSPRNPHLGLRSRDTNAFQQKGNPHFATRT
jgi:hypothetical protein